MNMNWMDFLAIGLFFAALFGIAYLALMYVLNPPHFGHTGESHFMYIDRNLIEVLMLLLVLFDRRKVCKKEVES